ncbi:MAG: hypothetical protein JSU70_03395 [Phycisphaerales bacterium]|nr:MAG: hypothetical protein JSU70_03395 [Phycisphaerales bacterium]
MKTERIGNVSCVMLLLFAVGSQKSQSKTLALHGVTVTPHLQSRQMRYRKATNFSLGARTQLFIQNVSRSPVPLEADADIALGGRSPRELLDADEWAWYDFPDAWQDQPLTLVPGAMVVWAWNGKYEQWGTGKSANMRIDLPGKGNTSQQFRILVEQPQAWLSAITFLNSEEGPFPDHFVSHIANNTGSPLKLESFRLWLPTSRSTWRVLLPQKWISAFEAFPPDRIIASGDRGAAIVSTGVLPLTYTVLETRLRDLKNNPVTLWAHLRIKREVFDVSGGWVSSRVDGRSTLTFEPYLKTLRSMHINTAHIGEVAGYTDNPQLYSRYPLKRFNKLADFDRYDTDTMLEQIHAVEFLGEPQYGGGRPVHPMDVWRKLAPYQPTRLATTVTHSEERIWRFYAGLSDYPHYDAYRVCAPSPDFWRLYERWGGDGMRWGAPLETIGEMTRSLRELSRPAPIACWSQGAHSGWDNYGGRERTSPTPQELRAQAYHALAARITSLYWFNLSLKSILKFQDLIDPIRVIGREIRVLEDYYLKGDAYHYERLTRDDVPDWDVSVIASPKGAVLFALDLDYKPDMTAKVFKFGPPRNASIAFPLPEYLRRPVGILKVDASAITPVPFELTENGVRIDGRFGDVNVFVTTTDSKARRDLEKHRKELAKFESSFEFDPTGSEHDLGELEAILAN